MDIADLKMVRVAAKGADASGRFEPLPYDLPFLDFASEHQPEDAAGDRLLTFNTQDAVPVFALCAGPFPASLGQYDNPPHEVFGGEKHAAILS